MWRLMIALSLTVSSLGVSEVGATMMSTTQSEVPGDTTSEYARQLSWFSRDKALHFGVSAIGSGSVYALSRQLGLNRWQSAAASAVLVGTAGILREIGTTHRNNLLTRAHLSRRDLVWDAAGIVLGISLTDLFLPGSRSAAAEKQR